MKKTLIATAIAGAMGFTATAQAAEVDYDLYGSLRAAAISEKDQSLDIKDNSSRVGIKATTELDGGITGMAHLEFKTNTETANTGDGRLAYIGAKGDFGTVTMGRQWTPQYLWTSAKVDILDVGSNPTHSYTYAGRQGNTLAYISPEFSGLQFAGVVIAAGGDEDSDATGDEFDAYNLAAHYKMGGLSVGASTVLFQNNVDESYSSIAASFEEGPMYVAAEVTSNGILDKQTNGELSQMMEVAGSYQVTSKAKVLANYVDFDGEGSQIGLEGQYKLGDKSRVALTAIIADSDAETLKSDTNALVDAGTIKDSYGATDTIAVSWRVDF